MHINVLLYFFNRFVVSTPFYIFFTNWSDLVIVLVYSLFLHQLLLVHQLFHITEVLHGKRLFLEASICVVALIWHTNWFNEAIIALFHRISVETSYVHRLFEFWYSLFDFLVWSIIKFIQLILVINIKYLWLVLR